MANRNPRRARNHKISNTAKPTTGLTSARFPMIVSIPVGCSSLAVADQLISLLNPRRVLDVGCAMGFLVECFRDRGVQPVFSSTRHPIGNRN